MPDEVPESEQKPENRITSYVTVSAYDQIGAIQKEREWSQAQVVRMLLDEALKARAAKAAAAAESSK
jgi:hypothetical protein